MKKTLLVCFTVVFAVTILVGVINNMVSNHSFSVPYTKELGTAAYDHNGIYVNAALEGGYTSFTLPTWVHRVSWIRIYARAKLAEAHAMQLQTYVYGATDNETYTTETINITKNSTSTNFADGDIIYWELTSADDVDLGHLTGGDSCVLISYYAIADGANCETDCYLQNIQVGVY